LRNSDIKQRNKQNENVKCLAVVKMAENLSSYTYSSVKRPRKKQCLQFLSEISRLSFDTDGPASENALSPNILTLEITISRRHSLTDETELSGTRRQFVTS